MLKSLIKGLTIFAVVGMTYAEVLVSEKKVVIPVDISTAKLKFTNRGYGETYLVKVIVPELAEHTLLNHRNEGEDGPCLFTYDSQNVADVVQSNPETLDVEFTIKQSKSFWFNGEVCKVSLVETIDANIRGFNFMHLLEHDLPDRVKEDCI